MKRINQIDEHIDKLKAKLDIGASDWTSDEKASIETCYFEITKVSVGIGRTVDLGCKECISSAVNIIKNYLALIARSEDVQETISTSTEWRDTVAGIEAKAEEVGFEIPKSAKKKADKLKALDAFLAEQVEEDDLLGDDEPTESQLIAIIKAKTGEDIQPGEYTMEELIAFAESDEDEEREA